MHRNIPRGFDLPSNAEGEEKTESQADAGADTSPGGQARSRGLQIVAVRLVEAKMSQRQLVLLDMQLSAAAYSC